MADEDLASQEAEGAVVETNETPANEDPVEALARELRWVPKDEWQGDPEAWKPAADYIKAGRDIQQGYARDVRSLREQMDRMAGVTDTLIREKEAERDAYWQAKLDKAVDDGDKEAARELVKQRPATTPQPRADAEVAAWIAKNPWYNADPAARVRAAEISDRLGHLPVAEQLEAAEKIVRKEFPEHFPQVKPPAATQTGNARNASPSNRAKGFADMPAESQAMARDMVSRHPSLTLEAIAKSYWQDQERVSR